MYYILCNSANAFWEMVDWPRMFVDEDRLFGLFADSKGIGMIIDGLFRVWA